MKHLLTIILFYPFLFFGQGEQRYADGTATDQDGNSFEWINYGIQDWAIENAEVITYRDGTEIPQVTDATEWKNLTTGAWCYYDNDPTKERLYNWYAVMGIHDNDENTPNKEFVPEGWHVPSDAEWTTLENYLIANGYNYDDTTSENKIAKAMASTTGWKIHYTEGNIGFEQSTNNLSGFNSFPVGERYNGNYRYESTGTLFWTSTSFDSDRSWGRQLVHSLNYLWGFNRYLVNTRGFSVRFVRNSSTASTKEYFKNLTIYPNPATNFITIDSTLEGNYNLVSILGKTVAKGALRQGENTIDLSNFNKGIYLLNVSSDSYSKTIKIVKE